MFKLQVDAPNYVATNVQNGVWDQIHEINPKMITNGHQSVFFEPSFELQNLS